MPEQWAAFVTQANEQSQSLLTELDGDAAPTANERYLIYQTLLGTWPVQELDEQGWQDYRERMATYFEKALREAKVNTNWSDPDEQYEKGCEVFIDSILKEDHTFLSSFTPFVKTVCEHAMVYTLSQTLIKLTAPGIPDIYQGCELWDLSFVDPDNRRPVDYERRMEFLFQLVIKAEKGNEALFEYLKEHREKGIEKLFITWKILNLRRSDPLLFSEGDYLPLAITGRETSAAAFARRRNHHWIIVAIPLGLVKR
jgi:(1->4)-alpha-D-glucan 1-alpha-D-glucosylmutase